MGYLRPGAHSHVIPNIFIRTKRSQKQANLKKRKREKNKITIKALSIFDHFGTSRDIKI